MKILVTGANGLIGSALSSALEEAKHQVIRAVRTSNSPWEVSVGDLSKNPNWDDALNSDVDVVVHLAAQVSCTERSTEARPDLCANVNTVSTANLAWKCAKHGVKRFIFLSTVKVLGEGKNTPYQDHDPAMPVDSYAISKWEAEQLLWQIAAETGMEVVVLRPPLVYGPKVKGNFLRLIQAIDKHRPLPCSSIKNQRSLIYLDNLVDVICLCLTHPAAAGRSLLVSDGDDVSTSELIHRIANALGKKPFVITIPIRAPRKTSAPPTLGKITTS